MAGFEFAYRLSGGAPTILDLTAKDSETLTKGDLLNLESGQVDLAASNDSAFLGVCLETKACTTAVSTVKVIVDEDAVYRVTDANARLIGANLDLTGATGAQTVTTDSNHDFVVVANCSATEPTLVKFAIGEHWLT